MLFNSLPFLLFFTVVCSGYWLLPRTSHRNLLLTLASYYFYYSWNEYLAFLILVTSGADYLLALKMERCETDRDKRFYLGTSIVMNLGILCCFKYLDFFLRDFKFFLMGLGIDVPLATFQFILPIGISFYTFEAINYATDVYRGNLKAEKNFANLLLFITFFPHLVAGPIVRARTFLPQIVRPKPWSWARFELGIRYFVMGIFKKLALADRLALLADPVFVNPAHFSSGATWGAVLAYTLQIYCDFSGYSDMAIGLAHMLGFRLARNFNMPYLALTITDFWRRWHISLSGWLRDYLYIPLGGNRGSRLRTYRNLMLTMLLGGLWHGANWTFVAWGGLHGLYLVGYRIFADFKRDRPWLRAFVKTVPGICLSWFCTQFLVIMAWVQFRAQSFEEAGIVYSRLFFPQPGSPLPMPASILWFSLAVVCLASFCAATGSWLRASKTWPVPLLAACYVGTFISALILAPDFGQPFIYFQF